MGSMKVLVFTNMFPTKKLPYLGIFVKELVDSLRKEGIYVDVFFINSLETKLNYFWSLFKLSKILKETNYDIINVHHSYCGFLILILKLIRGIKTPLVFTFHEGEIFRNYTIFSAVQIEGLSKIFASLKIFKKFILKRMDKVISVIKGLEDIVPKNKLEVIPLGVDLDLFKPINKLDARNILGLSIEKKIILFPADPKNVNNRTKNYHIAKESVDILNQSNHNNFMLLPLSNVSHEKVPIFMNSCDALILCSDYEASPMVIKEAMAVGLPITSVDVGDVSWLLGDLTGCNITSYNPKEIANSLLETIYFNKQTKGRERLLELKLDSVCVTKRIIKVFKNAKENN